MFWEWGGDLDGEVVPVATFTDEALASKFRALWPNMAELEIDEINPPVPDGLPAWRVHTGEYTEAMPVPFDWPENRKHKVWREGGIWGAAVHAANEDDALCVAQKMIDEFKKQ